MKRVNSFNEWDPLKEVVVGIAANAKYPKNDLAINIRQAYIEKKLPDTRTEVQTIPQFIIDETEEDLNVFVSELEKLGVKVVRPSPIDTDATIKTPYWETSQYFNYCPRDTMLVVGDTIIETPCDHRSRYFETFSYRDLLIEYLESGCKWISCPKPRLRDEDYIFEQDSPTILTNNDPIFDAANVLRMGKDIFYLVSNGGNELGLTWLKNALRGEYNVHPLRSLYAGTHIDTTLVCLRPGLMLANPERIRKDDLPEILKKWEIIYAPPMEGYSYSNVPPMSSSWLGMNLFVVNPNLAVVDAHQKQLIRLLEKHSFDVLPLKLRHGRVLDGGFHCVTLDIYREGDKEDYFS